MAREQLTLQSPSSMIRTAVYDAPSRTLDLTFYNGRTYTLEGVPADEVEGLRTSDSPGRYFNDHLKGKY